MLLCPASRRLVKLQNKLPSPWQINETFHGAETRNTFRIILAAFSASFVTHLVSQGQNPFVKLFTLQGLVRLR
jgi:hypothetical protein